MRSVIEQTPAARVSAARFGYTTPSGPASTTRPRPSSSCWWSSSSCCAWRRLGVRSSCRNRHWLRWVRAARARQNTTARSQRTQPRAFHNSRGTPASAGASPCSRCGQRRRPHAHRMHANMLGVYQSRTEPAHPLHAALAALRGAGVCPAHSSTRAALSSASAERIGSIGSIGSGRAGSAGSATARGRAAVWSSRRGR
jgi:hypothetical protein